MSDLLRVLMLVSVPAVGTLAGGLLAERVNLSDRSMSLLLHAVAGMLLGVVGVELMPAVLEGDSDLLMVLLFTAGGLFLVAINWTTNLVKDLRSTGGAGTAGWVILIGVSVDIVTDGLTIASGTTLAGSTGLLLALGLFMVDAPETFTTISTLKSQKAPRRMRTIATIALPVILVAGGVLGHLFLEGKPDALKLGVLAFTAGEIMALVVSQIVVQAHKKWDGNLATVLLVAGFSLFALLSTLISSGNQ